MANRPTMPFGIGAGPGQKEVAPVQAGSNTPPKGNPRGTGPNGPASRPGGGGNNRGSMPSGMASVPQPGGPGKATPSYMAPDVPIKTTGRHTALPGLTPTNVPGVPAKAFAPTGKTKGPGSPSLMPKGSTQPSAGPRSPIKLSGPLGKK